MTMVRSTFGLDTSWRESAAEPRPPENRTTRSGGRPAASLALTRVTAAIMPSAIPPDRHAAAPVFYWIIHASVDILSRNLWLHITASSRPTRRTYGPARPRPLLHSWGDGA